MPLEPPDGEPRHRKSHAALSAMAVDEQSQLWLLSAREIPGNGGLYIAGVVIGGGGVRAVAASLNGEFDGEFDNLVSDGGQQRVREHLVRVLHRPPCCPYRLPRADRVSAACGTPPNTQRKP
jgi:hypothetical protein